MALDPVSLAEEIKRTYALNLVGANPTAFKSILNRLGDRTRSIEDKLPDLVKMRGPYLQALGIPGWSGDSWPAFAKSLRTVFAPNGLAPEIIETFDELGFERLYRFQEMGMQAVLNDQNTLVVAATGRGKTESWMIPIFQYIIRRKRGLIKDETSAAGVKTLLIYPTKALAQDQLKRLIRYLFLLNRKLEPAARISVGIFDGDTPSVVSSDVRTYLFNAYKHFRCPIYDPNLPKCQRCTRALIPIASDKPGGRLVLNLPEPACRDEVNLRFIELTREDVIERRPDIVLTNPDTLNIRLLNINESEQRAAFIEEPKFIVLDEVHTYTELFGAFTAFILKRLRQERAHLRALRTDGSEHSQGDRLRLVAASATVANEKQLFSRLGNLALEEIELVEENPGRLPEGDVDEIPVSLIERRFDESDIERSIGRLSKGDLLKGSDKQLLALLGLKGHSQLAALTGEELSETAGEIMFSRLTDPADAGSPIQVLRYLHHVLSETPMTPDEIQSHLLKRFPRLTADEASNLVNNFAVVGTFSGVLENRVHLFTWPLDGYYTCLNCGAVYDQPRQVCRCGGRFVTKLVLCSICGQEALESWFCPHCHRLYPLSATVDGESVYYRGYTCNCTGEEEPTVRVIWRPYYRCAECGHITQITTAPTCERCGAGLVRQDNHLQCINPACGQQYYAHGYTECPKCHGSLAPVGPTSYVCETCGMVPKAAGSGMRCQCGGTLIPFTTLPWVCADPDCGRITFSDEPPTQCECGKQLHGLGALFDLSSAEYCAECDKYYLVGHSCGVEGHRTTVRPMDFRSFNVIDNEWQVRKASDLRGVVPCYHPYRSYRKNRRYETLMRSPANVAVTSAQYALRSVASDVREDLLPERLSRTKMLSFGDSHSDMEQLGRDFDEPEQRVFIHQLIVAELEQSELTLAELIQRVIARIQAYGEQLDEAADRGVSGFNWIRHYGTSETVADEVLKRFLPGFYNWRRSYRPALVRDGIVDIRLVDDQLDENERAIMAELARFNGQKRATLQKAVGDAVGQFNATLEQLERRGFLEVKLRGDYVQWKPEAFTCSLVGPDHPIGWDPVSGRFYATLEQQLRIASSGLESFDIGYKERATFSHPNFSRTAFRVNYTSLPLILRSEVYKGDVKKEKRRQIEYAFKFGNNVHFLSSGPTMEMGIDIGDLDLLLLFGTPPNINAYLQRVGRGGRRSKRSLVVSVSKRNPIDYYYYRRPQELISSSPQPVPLNEHNEEVMRISLTWALLDFVATTYWVPWRQEAHPQGDRITDGQDFYSLLDARPDGVVSYTKLVYYFSNYITDYGYPLRALSVILTDREDEARAYLRHLLDYPVCPKCGAHGTVVGQTCPTDDCDGQLIGAHSRYADLIEEVLADFEGHMVTFLDDLRDAFYDQQSALNRERDELRRRLRRLPRHERDQRQELQLREADLSTRIQGIEQVLEDLRGMSYTDTQHYTSESKYAYQIRSVSDVVEVTGQKLKKDGRIISERHEPRGMDMAIKEYHPYAIILKGGCGYVTGRVDFDDWKTQELTSRLEAAEVPHQYLACPNCGRMYDDSDATNCTCGARLRLVETQVLKRAHIYPLDFRFGPDPEEPGGSLLARRAFRFGAEEMPKSTFTVTQSKVCQFEPVQRLAIVSQSGQHLGDLDRGQLEIVTFADYASVSYESGLREPWPKLFEICGVADCNGVLVHGQTATFCALDPTHDVSQRRVVRPAHLFETEGLRLRLHHSGPVVTHSLVHGVRLALEKIGGVLVRSIGGLMDAGVGYIYDTTPGGSGVTRLLTQPSGSGYPHFTDALETMNTVVGKCQCDDGCPHCLYQYGCCYWNSPRTLSRQSLVNLLAEGLRLVPPDELSASTPSPVAGLDQPVWSAEETAAREAAWNSICELEARLRRLIEGRYEEHYGEQWIERLDPQQRQIWAQARAKDERAFARYDRPAPSLLDYSYLNDLLALINTEWSLFHDTFGRGRTNKRQLQGKIEAIIKVRNPLAHNRAVPENELKRAEVYCADLLTQIQQAENKNI